MRPRTGPRHSLWGRTDMGVGGVGEAGLSLYRALGNRLQPLVEPYLNRRTRRGKEDPARRKECFGKAGKKRPGGPLVWIHAASVGETNAVLPLLQRLRDRGLAVLLTTGTVTSAAIAERRLAAGAVHQYVPLDIAEYVERFLDQDADFSRFFAGGGGDRAMFDLPGFCLHRLREAGIGGAEWTGHCTYSDAARFFSYRRTCHRSEADYGRLVAAIAL